MICQVPRGFLGGAERADLVAIVEFSEPVKPRNPQALTARIIEVVAGEENRAEIRVWCGVSDDQQECSRLGNSRLWVVSLVRATNGPRAHRGYFLQFGHESALSLSSGVVTGMLSDDDAAAGRQSSSSWFELADKLQGIPVSNACMTRR